MDGRSGRRGESDLLDQGLVPRIGVEKVEDGLVLHEDNSRGVLTKGLFEKAQGLIFAPRARGGEGTPIWRNVVLDVTFGVSLPGDIGLPVGDGSKTAPLESALQGGN